MSRTTKNRTVEELSNGAKRTSRTGAPAEETETARLEQVGPFRRANVAISLSAVALTLGGVDADAPTKYIAGRAGRIVGLVWNLTAAATHVTGSVAPAVGAAGGTLVAVGTAASIDGGGTSAVVDQGTLAAPVSFAEGDALGALVTTDAAWLPVTTDLAVWLLIEWDA